MNTRALLWTYAIAVALLAAFAYPVLVGDYGPLSAQDIRAGLLLFIAAPAAELLVVHIPFRKSAHSFSLLELPLTLGLMTANPLVVVVAYTFGGALVLLVHRRQPPLKLLFNTSTFALTSTVAAAVFVSLSHSGAVDSADTWFAAIVGVLSASAVGTLLVFGVISIAERSLVVKDLRASLAFGGATASGGASLGIACAVIAHVSPVAVVFATAPLAAVFMANRAYESERQRRENLQLVYETSRDLTEGPESDQGLFAALQRCLDSLPCDFVAMFVPTGAGGVVDLRVDKHGRHRSVGSMNSIQPVFDLASAAGRARAFGAAAGPLGTGPATEDWARLVAALADPDLVEALVAPLVSGAELLGAVVVGSLGGSFRHVNEADAELLQTVCNGIASHTRLTRLAYEDVLTGLPNRRRLLQEMDAAYAANALEGRVLLLVDVDDFKGINDTFGHSTGDGVLVEAAARLKRAAAGALVARLGGDEFAIFAPGARLGDWESVSAPILHAFDLPIETAAGPFSLRISVGAALATDAGSSAVALRNADTALYEAKRLGKGHARGFNEQMHQRVARKYAMTDALRNAIGSGATSVVFQPVVDLRTGAIVSAEALSRWQSEELGSVSPVEFVQLAEEQGLSAALSRHVVAAVVDCLAGLNVPQLTVSLNVSPGDLADAGVLSALLAGAEAARPHILAVEVTERLLVEDPSVFEALATLRRAGLGVYIDDFGTGYSSLSYLKDLPADVLKIPRDFVSGIEQDRRSLALVEAVVAIGRALGLGIIAEGVETAGQRDILLDAGVEFGQGYLFSAPVSRERFVSQLTAPGLTRAA